MSGPEENQQHERRQLMMHFMLRAQNAAVIDNATPPCVPQWEMNTTLQPHGYLNWQKEYHDSAMLRFSVYPTFDLLRDHLY